MKCGIPISLSFGLLYNFSSLRLSLSFILSVYSNSSPLSSVKLICLKLSYTDFDICNDYGFEPSDCFFLATTRDKYYRRRRRMKYNDNARICITPLFDEYK